MRQGGLRLPCDRACRMCGGGGEGLVRRVFCGLSAGAGGFVRRRGWRLKTPKGALTEYLDPSNAAVREHVLSAVDELQSRYNVAGIHLDFVRWGDTAAKPRNAASVVSQFVAEARRRVRRPKWLTTAVYGRYPMCVATVGQDWVGWLNAGVVDYVVPMD